MKKFNICIFLKNDFYLAKYNKGYWGKKQNYLIYSFCKNHNAVIIDWKKVIFHFKKVILMIYKIAKKNGIMLSCLKYHWSLKKDLSNNYIKNCYFVFINKCHSFLNGFNFFIDNLNNFNIKRKTNYQSYRLPSLVLMTKNSWKNYDHFFTNFIKFKILSIKCGSFLQNDIFIFYNLMLENSLKIYNISKNIYSLNNIKNKKW